MKPKWPKIGEKYGRLTIVRAYLKPLGSDGRRRMCVDVECDCGSTKEGVWLNSIKRDGTVSCGCRKRQALKTQQLKKTTHGGYRTRLFRIWMDMRRRCLDPKHHRYNYYGGRSITICDEWVADFAVFREWSLANGYRDDLSIDRKKNDLGYCPENCRWTTMEEQANNRRSNHLVTAFGETKTMAQWLRDARCRVGLAGLGYRLTKSHWTPEEAIATPPLSWKKRYAATQQEACV
jgi:hypothetical protein